MHVRCNNVARSRNHFCSGNAKMPSMYVAELRVTVTSLYIQILSSAQQCIMTFVFPVTIERT
jgi:hypothetical protein